MTSSTKSGFYEPHDLWDFIKCQVCFEEVAAKTIQCVVGHLQILCNSCFQRIQSCIQCGRDMALFLPMHKGGFGMVQNAMTLLCPYKSCRKVLLRNSLEHHKATCKYNYQKFGKLVSLCNLMGYNDCSFRANSGNADEAIRHMNRNHGSLITSARKIQIQLQGSLDNVQESTWAPIVHKLELEQCYVIIKAVSGKGNESVNWIALYLPYACRSEPEPRIKIKISISTQNPDESNDKEKVYKWSSEEHVTSIQDLDSYILGFLDNPYHFPSVFSDLGENKTFPPNSIVLLCTIEAESSLRETKDIQNLPRCFFAQNGTFLIWNPSKGLAEAVEIYSQVMSNSNQKGVIASLENAVGVKMTSNLIQSELDYVWMGTVINVASQCDLLELNYFIKKGLGLNVMNEKLQTLLYMVLLDSNKKRGFLKMKELLKIGIGWGVVEYQKQSHALHIASKYSNTEAVEYLISHGMDPNHGDVDGNTPLHYAMINRNESERIQIIKTLIQNGASLKNSNAVGMTPVTFAQKHNSASAFKVIENVVDQFAKDDFFYIML